ncbi:MAG TPA: DUF3606 domain-containing protein [Reyranellaceae bacterium]|nr:DUF3606 domain-containing protein [Reyranellaceae bacterium]
MADDLSKRGPEDRIRINVNEDHERRYWCSKFACTEEDLRAAVAEVGVKAADVERLVRGL